MGIYVTSDLHFNHPKILKTCRPQFKTIEEHNNYIIEKINSVVGEDDLLYILGDMGFTPLSALKPFLRKMHGRKILILGNHDRGTITEYRSLGFIEIYDHPVYYSNNIILSHEPVKEAYDNPYVYNIHGHLHKSQLSLPNFINANIERTDYLPLSLKEIQSSLKGKTLSREEVFGKEWYKDFYQFDS